LWIFSNEIEKISGQPSNGDIVNIYNWKENFLGAAFFNKNSLISGRIISKNPVTDLKEFFTERFLQAQRLRNEFYPHRNSFRLIFSEGDLLPGLVIDKYNNTFVLQVYSYGMNANLNIICEILKEKFSAENIFTKNEPYFRTLEGLPVEDEVLYGKISEEVIDDGSLKFRINFQSAHKTGFYFDQTDNRFFIERLVKDKSVLDAFCNSGGFGLHSAKAGAASVTFVDSSAEEINNARYNYSLNNFNQPAEFIDADVFDYLEKCITENKKFDVVIIDPPAFAKSKKNLPQAKKGYEKLNRLALQVTAENGFLVTSSCSHHLSKEEFIQIINNAAQKTGSAVQLNHFNTASFDHPELPAMKETSYLKFAVVRKLQ